MLFNSVRFIFFFLPLTLAVSMRLKGKALLRFLTLASFFFYAYADRSWFLIPMLVTTVLDFLVAPKIAAASSRPALDERHARRSCMAKVMAGCVPKNPIKS